ncbi:MAG: enoyl-CoA hydratase-related protein [Pseudomonadota bacterium]
MPGQLLISTPSEGVTLLTLNRPDKMNALATPLLREIAEAVEAADADDAVRAVVITGNDKVFAAGADINELSKNGVVEGLADVRPAIWNRIRSARKPVLAAVEGYALGAGNELVLCADIAIAGEGAQFGQPETNLGIIPGAGGAALLPKLIGRARAMRLVLLGERLSAEEALACGLVSEVTDKGAALACAIELAAKIARRAPLAMIQGKAVIKAALDAPLDAALATERQAFTVLLGTEDKRLGTDAFLTKIRARWTGS